MSWKITFVFALCAILIEIILRKIFQGLIDFTKMPERAIK